ncbi:putative sulfate exporter family transporter [Kiritimatiellota bacterium B12222]|nr:putative sulfate exporter family transporter [Kiritimatiellota bacterium B12222]
MSIKTSPQRILPGLIISLLLAGVAIKISTVIPQPGAVCLAILLGLILGNLLPSHSLCSDGLDFIEHAILPLAISLMGSELQLQVLATTGGAAILAVLPPMILSILIAVPLGGLFGMSAHSSLMLGIGNSVCGSSAVLAASPVLKVNKPEIAVAIAAVNLMGTVGMFILPGLAEMLQLSTEQTANLIGGSLQAVGQVAASGFSISGTVGDQALIVKMLRVMMIGPIVLLLHHIFHPRKRQGIHPLPPFPRYIIGFLVFAVIGSLIPSDHALLIGTKQLAKSLLVIAMVAVGSRIHFRSLLTHGSKSLVVVILLTLLQTSVLLFLIRWEI